MTAPKYTLKEVLTARDERLFLDLPKRIHKDNPNWVCPLDNDIKGFIKSIKENNYKEAWDVMQMYLIIFQTELKKVME